MPEPFITDLREADVLLGRGSGPNDSAGNIYFRQLVQERKAEYLATNHRQTKGRIAQEIVDQVYARNGRFLRKLEGQDALDHGVPEGVEAWAMVDEDTIMEKAKQALRQNTQKAKGPKSVSPLPSNGNGNSLMQMPHNNTQVDLEPIPIGLRPPPTLHVTAPSASYGMPQTIAQQQLQQPTPSFIPDPSQSSTWQQPRQVSNGIGPSYAEERQAWTQDNKQHQPPHRVSNTSVQLDPATYPGPLDDDPDSMLALLRPPAVISTYPSSSYGNNNNHGGASEAADDADAPGYHNPYMPGNNNGPGYIDRRGSMTMNDLAQAHINRRRYSNMSCDTNVSDIMDSMSKLGVHGSDMTADQQQQARRQRQLMHMSTETMGTIDDFMGTNNLSMEDMSFATVDTSAFSTGVLRTNESTSSQSGSGSSSGGTKQVSPTVPKNVYKKAPPALDRNAYSAMSGNLGVLPTPPNLIRPEAGARRRGRRTSIDMNANENHDILESAEYIYHQEPVRGSGGDDDTANDMPRPGNLMKAPSDISALNDLGASSLSFKSPYASAVDMDMNSALFENLAESDFQ